MAPCIWERIGALIAVVVTAELGVDDWSPRDGWRLVNAAALLILTITVAFSVFGWRDPALLMPPAKPAPTAPEADNSRLLARLAAEMRRERLYRQDGLTIALDAGFGSLAPFNRTFRLAHGCTPSEFRARIDEKSRAD